MFFSGFDYITVHMKKNNPKQGTNISLLFHFKNVTDHRHKSHSHTEKCRFSSQNKTKMSNVTSKKCRHKPFIDSTTCVKMTKTDCGVQRWKEYFQLEPHNLSFFYNIVTHGHYFKHNWLHGNVNVDFIVLWYQ